MGEHVVPRTVATGSASASSPVGILVIRYDGKDTYNGQPIRDRIPFNAPDDWMKHISIIVRNRSTHAILAGSLQLDFRGLGGDPMLIHYIRIGLTPKHQLTTDAGKLLPQPEGESKPISIAPGDYATFSFSEDYSAIVSAVQTRGSLPQVTFVGIEYGTFYFSGGFRWSRNAFRRADENTPGKYVPVSPSDLMQQP